MTLIQTTGTSLGVQKPKEEIIQPLSLGKGDCKHNKLKNNNNEKAEKYYTSEGTN